MNIERMFLSTFLIFFGNILSFENNLNTFYFIISDPVKEEINSWRKMLKNNLNISERDKALEKVISVKDFGAVGDGLRDDTPAIQEAIDRVAEVGGGTVFFPSGIYKINIQENKFHAVTIRSNVTLKGASYRDSIIKLDERQGNYNAIFAGEAVDTNLSNFAMYDLTIDGNGSNNLISEPSIFKNARERYSVRIFLGKNINIERCRFTNQGNVNVITINNDENLVSDITIKNNIFDLIGGDPIDYDHSTIYIHGRKSEISNNIFASRHGAGTNGARTAIELHGDLHQVSNNHISGFANGIYLTGFARSSQQQRVTNNVIKEAHSGITIWSYLDRNRTSEYGIEDVVIANNQVQINVDDWRKLWGESSNQGIVLEPKSDAPLKNIEIANNHIYFTNFIQTKNYDVDRLGNGIILWKYTHPNVGGENIKVIGNNIENSLSAGIYLEMPIQNLEIAKNIIVNPGRSQNSFDDNYRAAILLNGVLENVAINENLLIDNLSINTMKVGIVWLGNCKANCFAQKNLLQVNKDANIEIFKSHSDRGQPFQISN
jgi:hypothetical protein